MSRLEWPAGFERTPEDEREPNRSFEATLGSTTKALATEMDRMDVDAWRGEIANAHTKSNGLPLHNAKPEDPGLVLRWTDDEEQFAIACDASPRLRDNVLTVYKWVHETRMRGQRPVRTGDTEFAAARLPPGDATGADVVAGGSSAMPAHEVLGVAPDAPENVVESAARARKAETHPDNGGDSEEFQRVVEDHLDLDDSVIALPADLQKDYPTDRSPSYTEIELADETVRTLRMYLASRWKDTAALWPSRQADRMLTESVRNVVRDAAVAADLRPLTLTGRGPRKT
jgi:hypothetical protein